MIWVLLTGFGPFPGVLENPSRAVALALDGVVVRHAELEATVTSQLLDVAWADGATLAGSPVRDASAALRDAVARVRPQLLLSLGVMPRETDKLRIETLACDSRSRRPDVCDGLPRATRARPGDAATLSPSLPAEAIAHELRAHGYAVELSSDAGKYLCEAIAYEGAWLSAQPGSGIVLSGFLHLPNTQAIEPLIGAVRVVIEACLPEIAAHAPRE